MPPLHHPDATRREGVVLGVPLGDLGWFQSLLMGIATGLIAFFLTTFVSIASLLVYTTVTHQPVDFAISYKRIGFPVGVGVAAAALLFLGYLWFRRILRGKSS